MKKTENPDYDAEALSMDLESQLEKEMKLLESGLGIPFYYIPLCYNYCLWWVKMIEMNHREVIDQIGSTTG